MRKAVSTYLFVLGVIQLIGLNLGGFFWLAWASGIREKRPSSRRWVIAIHCVYLALCALALCQMIVNPNSINHIRVFGYKVDTPPLLIMAFIISMVLVYGLPVVWLMKKTVKEEFIKPTRVGQRLS